MKILGSLSL